MNDAEAITFAWLAFGIALGVWLLIYFLDSWIEVKSEKKKLPGGGEGGGTAVAGGIAALPVAVERPALPKKVRIVEVGPRDGLQNEAQPLDVAAKVRLIEGLVAAGIRYVEAGSFVSPKWVPQMAGSAEVFAAIERVPGVTYAALTPNLRGFERAMEAGVAEVAVFAAASEAFSERNINCSIAASLERFAPVMAAAGARGVRVRGYVSCVLGCPYEGAVAPRRVLEVSSRLLKMGCYEVSLGDTVGVGTVAAVDALFDVLLAEIPAERLAVHFHDTYGQALANVYAALQRGVAVVDSSVAGLGGCPYARGAAGNLATEDLVYMLDGLGVEHGVDLGKLVAAGAGINGELGRRSGSKVALAMGAEKCSKN